MKPLKFALLTAGVLAAAPALAQTAGGTANTGPQGRATSLLASRKAMATSGWSNRTDRDPGRR